jgi:signal transduction histidine kinase
MACNNSGVWNEAGSFLDFSVAPAYYQTNWFRTLCAVAFLGLLWLIYALRVRQLHQKFAIVLDARVNERTRIARDLHDTMLQSFQAVLMQMHAMTYIIKDPPEAQQRLKNTIKEARQAITEGRDAVQGLRSSTLVTNDLAGALNLLGKVLAAQSDGNLQEFSVEGELAAQSDGNRPEFSVAIEGTPRDLVPILRDEVCRIASEALRNAFRHAHAQRIEVEIHYDRRQLRLRVRDDGKGIDPEVLKAGGRVGHYGFPSMHERAKLIGGKLSVWSELDSGTETELTIPASIAYAKAETGRRLRFWTKGA